MRTYDPFILKLITTAADQTTAFSLPPGMYMMKVIGVVAGASDATIRVNINANAAKTSTHYLYMSNGDNAPGASAFTMAAGTVALHLQFEGSGAETAQVNNRSQYIPVPYGGNIVIDINSATSIELTLVAVRYGS